MATLSDVGIYKIATMVAQLGALPVMASTTMFGPVVSELVYGERGEITGFVRATGSEDTHLIHINQEDCIRCNACVDACPVDCISIQKVSRGVGKQTADCRPQTTDAFARGF